MMNSFFLKHRWLTCRLVVCLVWLMCGCVVYAQKQNIYQLPIPTNLDECFEVLDQTYSDETLQLLKDVPEDSVMMFILVSDEVNLIAVWQLNHNSTLAKYFYKKGLESVGEMYEVILLSYHRYLNSEPIELKEQIESCKHKREVKRQELLVQLEADSIHGVYIPYDLHDCFTTLDSTFNLDEIRLIKELPSRNSVVKYLPQVCDWIKGAWFLNEPSRLRLYMYERGVEDPMHIATVILCFYYDWLHQDNVAWHEFDKHQ